MWHARRTSFPRTPVTSGDIAEFITGSSELNTSISWKSSKLEAKRAEKVNFDILHFLCSFDNMEEGLLLYIGPSFEVQPSSFNAVALKGWPANPLEFFCNLHFVFEANYKDKLIFHFKI